MLHQIQIKNAFTTKNIVLFQMTNSSDRAASQHHQNKLALYAKRSAFALSLGLWFSMMTSLPPVSNKRKTHHQSKRKEGSAERLRRVEAWAGCRKGPWIMPTSPAGRQRRLLSGALINRGASNAMLFPNPGQVRALQGPSGEFNVAASYGLLRHATTGILTVWGRQQITQSILSQP